jgi:hypothetical protein
MVQYLHFRILEFPLGERMSIDKQSFDAHQGLEPPGLAQALSMSASKAEMG